MRQRNVRRRRAVATWRRIMKNPEGQANRPIYHAYYCHLRGHSRRSCRPWSLPVSETTVYISPASRKPTREEIQKLKKRLEARGARPIVLERRQLGGKR